jgi:guanylate kinase
MSNNSFYVNFFRRIIICLYTVGGPVFINSRKINSKVTDKKMSSQNTIIVISGPSGSGKSTLLKRLFKEFPDSFGFSVSHTTRKPRQGEVDGVDYHFITAHDFEIMVKENKFIEYATFSANSYGTSFEAVAQIKKKGNNMICVLDIDREGVKSVKRKCETGEMKAKFLFIQPPSIDILKERLIKRGTETEDSLKRRLDSVAEDLRFAQDKSNFDLIVVNDDLEKAYLQFKMFCCSV